MSAGPEAGTVLGRFDVTIDRSRVWPVDWAVGLDEPEYQDPDVATATGMPNMPVPPGGLVFFAFLPDHRWLDLVGISFDRSLATRRQIRILQPVYVGDRVQGEPTIIDVATRDRPDGSVTTFVTISTTYVRSGEPVVEELVTYATRGVS